MRRILLLPNFLLFIFFSYSQDSSVLSTQIGNAVNFYTKYIGENSGIYNGSEYVAYDFHIQGHQYYEWNNPQPSSVKYDGIFYEKVPLAYDIVRDEVITTTYNDNVRIRLVSEKISYFSIQDHFFERLIQDSSNKSVISTGFYERLYNGQMKVFAKRKKKIQEVVNTTEGDKQWFKEFDQFFVLKKNTYYAIQSKSDLFSLFDDKGKAVKKYLRKNKLKFKRQPESTILYAVKYYDQLKN